MMKRMSRYSRTSRVLVLLLCAFLLAGMLPSFSALGAASDGKGSLQVRLKTDPRELKGAKVEFTLYKIGVPAPETAAGWEFDSDFESYGKQIIAAREDSALQTAVNSLAKEIVGKRKGTAVMDLSSGSASLPNLDFGIYLGVLTKGPEGLNANASLFTIPSWNANKTTLLYDLPVTVKDTYTGDLTISKAVVSPYAPDKDATYSFAVSLEKDGKALEPDQTFKTTAGDDIRFTAGKAQVQLKGGESVTIIGLPHGVSYTVTEDDAKGLTATSTGAKGSIAAAHQTAAFTNTRETGTRPVHSVVTINKADEANQGLDGATFALYAEEALTTEITRYEGKSFQIKTDDAKLAGYLPAAGETRTLYLAEIVAPTGYQLDQTPRKVTISASASNAIESNKYVTITTYAITIDAQNTATIINTPVTDVARIDDYVTVTKTDGSEPLEGATFTLYDGETAIKTFTGSQFQISTADAALKDVLPAADATKELTLKETAAPAGYKGSDATYKVVINATKSEPTWNAEKTKKITTTTYDITINKEKSLTVVNLPIGEARRDTKVTVTKTDKDHTQISGATFTLYDGENVVTTFTGGKFDISTSDEKLQSLLPAVGETRTLTLKETGVPAGYTGSDAEYTVKITASVTTALKSNKTKLVATTTYDITIDDKKSISVVNTPITDVARVDGAVTVTKTDENGNQISGATFTLYDGENEVTTFNSGKFEISTANDKLQSYLPAVGETKTLTLKETAAPTGYIGSATAFKVEITASETTKWNADHTKQVTTTVYAISIEGGSALRVPNTPIPDQDILHNSVTVNKVDENSNPLSGAQFTLYSGNTAIKTYSGTSFGISTDEAELAGYLPPAGQSVTLKLKETKAPDKYQKSDREYNVIIRASESTDWNKEHTRMVTTTVYTITIVNDTNKSLSITNTPIPDEDEPTGGGGVPPTAPEDAETPPEELIDIEGTKFWNDDSNVNNVRPGSIEITLYADGSPVNVQPVWTKSGNRWSFKFTGLPKVDSTGKTIDYTVQESPVEYYSATVSGLSITNNLKPAEPERYVELSGEKTWVDKDNESRQRPLEIVVRLFRDGVEIETRRVTAATDWKYTFGNLPADNGYGHTYTYELREDSVPGYFKRIDGMNVTNTVLNGNPPPPPTNGGETPPPGGTVPNVPERPEDIPDRKTGTPVPRFEELGDEELEELFDMFGYGTPLYGMLGTGDQVPAWVWVCAGAGVLALALFIILGRKKKSAK